jgi:hypothetical protein
MWQVDVIMACAILIALEPIGRWTRAIRNYADRRRIHKRHLDSL